MRYRHTKIQKRNFLEVDNLLDKSAKSKVGKSEVNVFVLSIKKNVSALVS